MTTLSKDEIVRLAREAKLAPSYYQPNAFFYETLERFATLARADLVAKVEAAERMTELVIEGVDIAKAELAAECAALKADAERMHWVAMHGTFGVDSVTGEVGGNGLNRKAATRHNIDAAMKRGEA